MFSCWTRCQAIPGLFSPCSPLSHSTILTNTGCTETASCTAWTQPCTPRWAGWAPGQSRSHGACSSPCPSPAPSPALAYGWVAASCFSVCEMFSVKHSDVLFPLLPLSPCSCSHHLFQTWANWQSNRIGKIELYHSPLGSLTLLPVFESAHFLHLLMRVPIDQWPLNAYANQ